MAAAPIVKWVGGKTKLLPELKKRLPSKWNRYFEPFVGGAALFFSLEPADAVLSDMNKDLVDTYREVARDVDAVIDCLRGWQEVHFRQPDKEWMSARYYEARQRWNDGMWPSGPSRAAAFLYLNKTCFNGLWRVNKGGRMNVPVGDYTKPNILNEDALRAAAPVLRRADLQHGDFDEAAVQACPGDLVYFDPPYDPVSKTSDFTSYTKSDFDKAEQEMLATRAKHLVEAGVYVMLSNHDTPFIRSLYQGLRIDTVRCPRAINSKGDKRGAVDEVIICGGYG